jgi:hypothetical protein
MLTSCGGQADPEAPFVIAHREALMDRGHLKSARIPSA